MEGVTLTTGLLLVHCPWPLVTIPPVCNSLDTGVQGLTAEDIRGEGNADEELSGLLGGSLGVLCQSAVPFDFFLYS